LEVTQWRKRQKNKLTSQSRKEEDTDWTSEDQVLYEKSKQTRAKGRKEKFQERFGGLGVMDIQCLNRTTGDSRAGRGEKPKNSRTLKTRAPQGAKRKGRVNNFVGENQAEKKKGKARKRKSHSKKRTESRRRAKGGNFRKNSDNVPKTKRKRKGGGRNTPTTRATNEISKTPPFPGHWLF